MKRYGNLYAQICAYEHLEAAYVCAAKGKASRPEVMEFAADLEANLRALEQELRDHTYRTPAYKVFTKTEPKERVIFKLPFRDRVVHWAIMLVVEPIWVSTFTRDVYACVKGRGIHPCLAKLRRDLASDPEGTAYCLKLDVRKFYPSIDHDIMKSVIRRKIKDPELLWLLDEIIDSADGVPIGNYLSQFFANLYLAELDHIVKEQLRYYYRYADDIVLLGADKATLHSHLVFINHYLHSERRLDIKRNYQVYPVESRGIDFVGYVTYHTHCLARKRNKQNLARRVAAMKKRGAGGDEIRLRLASQIGFMQHCDSIHFLDNLNIGMKKFSEVTKKRGNFEGQKLKLDNILDRPLQLTGYQIGDSRYRDTCLTLQFKIEESVRRDDGSTATEWVQHICFTGSQALVKQLDGVEIDPDDGPFCKIIKQELDGGRCFYKIIDPE